MEGRQKKICGEYGCEPEEDENDTVSVDDEVDNSNSRLDLGAVGTTITDKVSDVGSSVSGGIDVSGHFRN